MSTAALAEKSKSEVISVAMRARGMVAKHREAAKAVAMRGTQAGLAVGSGWAVGAIRKKFGTNGKTLIPGTEIEADLVVGAVLTAAGLLGVGDEYAPQVIAMGSGTLAAWAALQAAG